MQGFKEAPHKAINSYGNRPIGPYSTRAKVDKATDVMGTVVPYVGEPYKPANSYKRDAYKGAQIKTLYTNELLNKIQYHPAPYEDKTKRDLKSVKGFCSSKPFGRDEMSSSLDVIRYRDTLEKEEMHRSKFAATHTIPTSPIAAESSSRPAFTGTVGLTARFPKNVTDYDRIRHEDEFRPKIGYGEKYTRDFGAYKTSSQEVGECCADPDVLQSPSHGRSLGQSFFDSGHLLASSISGSSTTR